jgi:phytoene dehydrogenase-like protein
MPDKWDVIVVGTGIGGLTAAAMLVQKGLNVLALDRNPHPGGTAYVYTRKGFTFPMGPLGFSTPSTVKETLNKLDGGDLKLSRVQYRIRAFDLEIPLSLPFPMMIKELTRLFPQRQIDRTIFKDVEAIVSAIQFPEVDPFRKRSPAF